MAFTVPQLTPPAIVETTRLILRPWRDADREPFSALGRDPEVMRFFEQPLDRVASDALIDRVQNGIDERGWGFWAVEVKGGPSCIGFIGLNPPVWDAPFMPCVEIGWRLDRAHWHRGYATEGARAALRFGFDTLGLDEIVAFVVPENAPSRAVMARLGMHRDEQGDFLHPRVTPGHRLSLHCLYRLSRACFQERLA